MQYITIKAFTQILRMETKDKIVNTHKAKSGVVNNYLVFS